jgi:hypothetical protein
MHGQSSSPGRGQRRIFSLSHSVQTDSGTHQASYLVDTVDFFPLGVKRSGCDADRSPPSNAEFKNEWSYTSTPPYVLISWCLIIHGIRLNGVVLS